MRTVNKKLFVGNLSYQTTQDQLETLFSQCGPVVDAVVLQDRYSGRSRGFGFVEMETEEQAAAAIEKLNGTVVDGRPLNVAEARPRRQDNRRSADRW